MIFSSIFNFLIVLVIIGFSYIFKCFLGERDKKINNLDLLYGLFILISLSLFLNFILPLKIIFFPIILIGLSSFIICFNKKLINLNLSTYFIIIFIFIFIIYLHGENEDSPMYHLQIIKWIYNYKITLGLTNLEIRLGDNSLWFNFLSLFQFKFNDFNSIHTLNVIPFSILIYEIMKPKKNISYLFLNLALSFLFFFSFLHPFRNGIILNHLHNPEVDTIGMIFFIMSFYLTLMCFDERKKNIFNFLLLSSLICLLTKISYIGVILFPIAVLILFFRKNLQEILAIKLYLIMGITLTLWFLKNFFVSGCFIFPISFTCMNVPWSVGADEIETYSNVIKGFARDTRERLRYLDFDHTINSFNWFLPWFKDYALNTSLLKISFTIIFFCFSFLLLLKTFTNLLTLKLHKLKYHILISLFLLINLLVWFQAPEIRFGWGTIITLNCYLLAILFFYNIIFEKLDPRLYKYLTIFFLLILFIDNKKNLNKNNLINPYMQKFNYSKIEKIFDLNGRSVFHSKNRKCYDFMEICVNAPKEKYFYSEKLGHLIFTKDKQIEK